MNIAGLLGIIAALGITAYSIMDSTNNPKIFMDPHAIFIVIGGTITVGLLSFSFKKLFLAIKIILRKVLGRDRDDYLGAIRAIVRLSEVYRTNPRGLLEALPPKCHPFLRDAANMITNYGFNVDEMDEVLTNAIKGKSKRDDEEIKVWHTVSRFPPAFGLLGATVGMIALLQTLGEPGAQNRIGPAMATALIATFYGLALANLVLLPITEKLTGISSGDILMRKIIKDGVLMILERRHPVFIEEYLKSFLAPSMREDKKEDAGEKRTSKKAA